MTFPCPICGKDAKNSGHGFLVHADTDVWPCGPKTDPPKYWHQPPPHLQADIPSKREEYDPRDIPPHSHFPH